jgi:hypothetical protein
MSEILLVNPRRRARRKGRSAAQKAATRRMIAANRAKRSGGSKKRRRNPVAANPRRRRRKAKRVSVRRRRNPIAANPRRRIRRRRNPISTRGMMNRFKPKTMLGQVRSAVPGAVGALGLDVIMGYASFIPPTWRVGIPGYLVKAVGAIALGAVASNFVRPATANAMTEGALTVMLHGVLRQGVSQYAPQVQLGMYLNDPGALGYYGSGWNPNYEPGDLGAYLPDMSMDSLTTDQTDLGTYVDGDGF